MTPPVLLIERHGAVALVSLNRPQCLNALDQALASELTRLAGELADDDSVRAVVLTGTGRAFCSGADLSPGALPLVGSTRGAAVRYLLETVFNPIIEAWVRLPKPLIVAQNGLAAGGGVGLALTADFLLMAESASMVQVFVPKLGLVPDMGVSVLLPQAIGAQRAQALAYTGAPLTAQDAERVGAACQVTPDADLLPQALALAQRLARSPREALAATKQLFKIDLAILKAGLAREAEYQEALANTANHQEGLAAFAEKRPAQFN
jgi:2-(1,2-epoxy-1,2-dihydrophenyl)acetyl-CoA isomerase